MTTQKTDDVRVLCLVGPTGAGKTTLMEALLAASGVPDRKVGDSSPEARARGHSVEINLAGFDFLGDTYRVIDCPGAVDLAGEADAALAAADLAIIVVEPDTVKAALLAPVFHQLEALGIPRAVFVNKMDQAKGALDDLLRALAPVSAAPLVARQLPMFEGEKITGYVDLALERAFVYRPGEASRQIDLTPDLVQSETDARFHMLEQLADFDDDLMEQLLSDLNPGRDLVFTDLVRELNEGLIVPVFFGAAQNGFGIRRLLKALRHEMFPASAAATRMGLTSPGAYVFKTAHAGQAGKLSYLRVFGASLADGAEFILPGGQRARAGGLFHVQGASLNRIAKAPVGDVVAVGKLDQAATGMDFGALGAPSRSVQRPPLFGFSISASNRKDDVRLSSALAKLLEEDTSLSLFHDPESHEILLLGQGESHLRLTLDRLKRRFSVEVQTRRPPTAYRETIRSGVTQRGRHKKQTGGHGQFADVTLEIAPRPRGAGFAFANKITGGVVPKQWIPAVEMGVRDGLTCGPLGFAVEDVEVTLIDGSFHAVDSSEMAFRTAGRIAVEEGLAKCAPYPLEPIDRLSVFAPAAGIAGINAMISGRRGQILGFGPREGWRDWDVVDAFLPQNERHDLIAELRGLTQGLGAFEAKFDHMAEVTGRMVDEVVAAAKAGR